MRIIGPKQSAALMIGLGAAWGYHTHGAGELDKEMVYISQEYATRNSDPTYEEHQTFGAELLSLSEERDDKGLHILLNGAGASLAAAALGYHGIIRLIDSGGQ